MFIFLPPSSPDMNTIGYYVSGVVETDFNNHPQNTDAVLRSAIASAMANSLNTHLSMASSQFCLHLKTVNLAGGGLINDVTHFVWDHTYRILKCKKNTLSLDSAAV